MRPYLDSLAWVLFKLNQPQEALSYAFQAVELSEAPDATVYDHLGDIYAALQQMDKAREAWRKVAVHRAERGDPEEARRAGRKVDQPARSATMAHRFQKHYTREEARALLPQVREWLKQLLRLRGDLERLDKRLGGLLASGLRCRRGKCKPLGSDHGRPGCRAAGISAA